MQQRTQFTYPARLGPRRMHGAQVHTEDPEVGVLGHDLEKRVLRPARTHPVIFLDRHAAHEPE